MDARISQVEPDDDASWSENTTPGSDDIEEVVRQPGPTRYSALLSIVVTSKDYGPRALARPIRRRLRPEERLRVDRYRGRSYQEFRMPTMGSRRVSDTSSSSMTTTTSATSPSEDPWSSPQGFAGGAEDGEADFDWEQHDDDMDTVVPKIEPIDDDVNMAELADLKGSVAPEEPPSSAPAQGKRPRGRPRKHPKPSDSIAKIAKGRSKTGCITCRKRKKKCDEAKPSCNNCEKNSVKCEGYPEKTIWKSGKEKKAEEAARSRVTSISLPNIQLPAIIPGVETPDDRIFLNHYIARLSLIFTVERECDNAFRKILLPYGNQFVGVMHSLLSLAGSHLESLDYSSPYVVQLLRDHPKVDASTLQQRFEFHKEQALKAVQGHQSPEAIYGQMICLVLLTLAIKPGEPSGEHHLHLQAYRKIRAENPPCANEEAEKFFHEFFHYHISLKQISCLPKKEDIIDDLDLPNTVYHPSAVRLLGVFDGLFIYMSQITSIRNKIRENLQNGVEPAFHSDYADYWRAAEIDAGIKEWTPAWPEGDPRDLAGRLYRQMLWIYLFRTTNPPSSCATSPSSPCPKFTPDPRIKQAVNDGIRLLSLVPPNDPSQTLVLAPAFVIGCAAFEPEQRVEIRKAIGAVKRYMGYNNSDVALQVLEKVWGYMDEGNPKSWDWQQVAADMGMDFLAT